LGPEREITTYHEAAGTDRAMQLAFCREIAARGVYVAPAWHHGLCAAHTDELVDEVADRAEQSARAVLARSGPDGA
jgi:glutamate-1-semialdehyde aminotransferase